MEYIYCNEISLNESLACELIPQTDEYLLDSLKSLCEDLLSKRVNEENVIKLLILADTYGTDELKNVCFGFIIKNYFQIEENEGLSRLPQRLCLEILRYNILNTKSNF